jgi:hypothetical protein
MTVKERISEFQKTKGYTDFAFEKVIGKGRGSWHSTTNPSADFLSLIFTTFPELSTEYVFRGKGDMVKKQGEEADSNVEKYYESIIRVKNERIDQLERELAKLRLHCDQGKIKNNITNNNTAV